MPDQIGKYPIKKPLAVGGMGVVYLAWHPSLMCEVVIKTIKPERSIHMNARKKMLEEQRAMGRIRHPSIVAVLDADTDGNLPFIVMERVAGVTLTQWVTERSARAGRVQQRTGIGWPEACRIGQSIAEGLNQLHQSGLIHRDVKPGNVMIDSEHNVKLLDLGLATDVIDSRMAQQSEPVGTPRFVSPEQADGREIDIRTDLYGLGATITFMLSARPVESPHQSLTQDGCGESLPDDLQLLLKQLLDDDPERRPSSAALVAAKLADIKPRPRIRPQTLFALLLAIGLLTLSVAALGLPEHETNQTHVSDSQGRLFARSSPKIRGPLPDRLTMTFDTVFPRPHVINAKLSKSSQHLACFGVGGNLRIYDISHSTPELIQLVRCYANTNVNHPQIHWMDGDQAIAVTGAEYDPLLIWDIKESSFRSEIKSVTEIVASELDSTENRLAICDASGRIAVYDSFGKLAWESNLGDNLVPKAIAWSDDSSILLVATNTSTLIEFSNELSSRREIQQTAVIHSILRLDGGAWVLGDQHGVVHHVDHEFTELNFYQIADRPVRCLASSSGLHQIVAVSRGVHRLDLATGVRETLPEDPMSYSSVFVQQTKSGVLIAGGSVRHVSFENANQISTLISCSRQSISSIEFDSNNRRIAICSINHVFIANTQGEILSHYDSKVSGLEELRWSPDGTRLAAVSGWGGRDLYLWERDPSYPDQLKLQHVIEAPKSVVSVGWIDNETIVTAGESGIARLWDVETGTNSTAYDVGDFVRTIAISPNRKRIALGFEHNGIQIVDLSFTLSDSQSNRFDGTAIRSIRWHPHEQHLAAIDENRYIRIIDLDNQTLLAEMHSRWTKPTSIAWQPGANQLDVTPLGAFRLGENGDLVRERSEPRTKCVAWSSDGTMRAVGDALSAVHFFHNNQHSWTILLDQADTAITVNSDGDVLFKWGTTSNLIRQKPPKASEKTPA